MLITNMQYGLGKIFENKTQDSIMIYTCKVILLLTGGFESFCSKCIEIYETDSAYFLLALRFKKKVT